MTADPNNKDAVLPVDVDPALCGLIMESTPHCIVVIDSEFRLVFGNRNFQRFAKSLLGNEVANGQSLIDWLPKDRMLRFQLRLQEVLSGQCTRTEEVLEVKGQTRYFDVTYQPLTDSGSWDKVVVHFEEITARKLSEKRMLARESELEESLKTRETLLSIISHDLRSPIFQMNSLLYVIQQSADVRDEKRLQMYAEDLEQRVYNLTHTLDNLLSWSTLQRQNLEPQVTRFALKSVIKQAVGLMKPVADRKGVTVNADLVEPIHLGSDRELVAFIVRNLINNAIKFSMQNGKIGIVASQADNYVVLSITDEGVGVTQDKINELKRSHQLFSEAGTWGERGTGLGLKLCYEFTERLKGNITFQSTRGKGTVVTVQLPQWKVS